MVPPLAVCGGSCEVTRRAKDGGTGHPVKSKGEGMTMGTSLRVAIGCLAASVVLLGAWVQEAQPKHVRSLLGGEALTG